MAEVRCEIAEEGGRITSGYCCRFTSGQAGQGRMWLKACAEHDFTTCHRGARGRGLWITFVTCRFAAISFEHGFG